MFMEFYFANTFGVNFLQPGYRAGVDPELEFGGHYPELDLVGPQVSHVKSFLTLLFAIGHIDVWGPWPPWCRGRLQLGSTRNLFKGQLGV